MLTVNQVKSDILNRANTGNKLGLTISKITVYVGSQEFHSLSMTGLNQSMKIDNCDVVHVRLNNYYRIEVEVV